MEKEKFEIIRIKLKRILIVIPILVICFFLAIPLFLFLKHYNIISIIFIIIVLMCFLFVLFMMINKSNKLQAEYDKLYYNNIVLTELKKPFKNVDFTYENSTDNNEKAFFDTLFNIGNSTIINKYLLATYKNIKFRCFNFFSTECHDHSGNNASSFNDYDIFRGYWLAFELNSKICKGSILLESKGDRRYDIKSSDLIKQDYSISNFDVYAFNTIDVTSVISPKILNVVNDYFNNNHYGTYIYMENDKIYIGIANQKGLFESLPYKKIDINKINYDIKKITSIIEKLIFNIIVYIE